VSNSWIAVKLAFAIPIFFVALWLGVTSLLSVLSGWSALMQAFPDRDETPVLSLSGQSGSMGLGVNMRGVLTIAVCPSGLRIGMPRLLAPFSRDFLVPWDRLSVTRKRVLFMDAARLQFGPVGTLTVSAALADKLARAAGKNWPEPAAIP
jgi:hypothetical protein